MAYVRKCEAQRYERALWLYELICEKPGRKIRQIERDTGKRPGSLYSLLAGLPSYSLLIFEDDEGNLYPLCNRSSQCAILSQTL